MAWENVRNKVKSKLEGVSTIQEVLDFPSEEFTGFPVAVIETVRNDADFQTTNDNRRTYVFNIYLIQEIEKFGPYKSRRIIEGVVDDVIDVFDEDQLLTGIVMPDREVLVICLPALSRIYTEEGAKYVVGLIELKVITQFSIS